MLRNDLKLVLIFSFRLIHWVTPGSLFTTIRWRWPKFKKLSQVQILVIWWNCVWGSCYLSMYQWIIKGTTFGSTQIHFTTGHQMDFLNCAQVLTSSVIFQYFFTSFTPYSVMVYLEQEWCNRFQYVLWVCTEWDNSHGYDLATRKKFCLW